MSIFKKKGPEPEPEELDASVGTAADVEEVMRKYDRESNTRIWTGLPRVVIRYLTALFSVYCIVDTV